MKEICLKLSTNENFVFKLGRDFGDGIVEDIHRDGSSIVIKDTEGDERVFPDPAIVWYVEDTPVKLEIVQ